ncbi:MAG: hypothetical protein FWG45_04360 [Oscillospiraceae bacterium]|nr:hypothetical protein [Oscillospiraceae bacterium]
MKKLLAILIASAIMVGAVPMVAAEETQEAEDVSVYEESVNTSYEYDRWEVFLSKDFLGGNDVVPIMSTALQILRYVVGMPSVLDESEEAFRAACIVSEEEPGLADALQVLRYITLLPSVFDDSERFPNIPSAKELRVEHGITDVQLAAAEKELEEWYNEHSS